MVFDPALSVATEKAPSNRGLFVWYVQPVHSAGMAVLSGP